MLVEGSHWEQHFHSLTTKADTERILCRELDGQKGQTWHGTCSPR